MDPLLARDEIAAVRGLIRPHVRVTPILRADGEELARRDDAWLEEQSPFREGQPANNHFKWFHVFEDELNHRGQIRWLRKRARW